MTAVNLRLLPPADRFEELHKNQFIPCVSVSPW